jgi:predicted lipoprotein with Yx(FWY)xxD motif
MNFLDRVQGLFIMDTHSLVSRDGTRGYCMMKHLMRSVLTVFVVLMIMTTARAQESKLTVIPNDHIGNYLADGDGRTLYWHKFDSPGKSTCSDECIQMWPPFYQEKITPPDGVSADDFGSVTRDDGMKQTTFKGYPLYYFSVDQAKGDVKGYDFEHMWFTVIPQRFPFIPLYPHSSSPSK